MRCNEFHEKIIAYLEGSLTDKEQQSFSEHLAECASCRQELQHARDMDSLLAEKVPAYGDAIVPSVDFISRLQSTGPWTTPAKPASGLRQWLFAPWQSRRIVTAALSAALVISLTLLGPRAYMTRESVTPAPTSGITSSEEEKGLIDRTYSIYSTEPPAHTSQSGTSDTATSDTTNSVAPGAVPAETGTPSMLAQTPTPIPTTVASTGNAASLITLSGSGTVNSEHFEVKTSPWELQWSVISGPGDITIEIIDSESETKLGELVNNLATPVTLVNNTTVYNRTGNIYLVVKASDTTSWQVQIIPAP